MSTLEELILKARRIKAIQQRQQKMPKPYKLRRRCEICGDNEQLQPHHISYNPQEIITVCNSCHGLIHNRNIAYEHNTFVEKKATTPEEINQQIEQKINEKKSVLIHTSRCLKGFCTSCLAPKETCYKEKVRGELNELLQTRPKNKG